MKAQKPCTNDSCPVRDVCREYGKYGGGAADDTSRLIVGGGHKPCCDIVLDNVRFHATVDALHIAYGHEGTKESFTELVTRYMQPTCQTTARLLDRALTAIGGNVDLKTSMSIPSLQYNLDNIARACGKEAPRLESPPAANMDIEDVQKRIAEAHKYAQALEKQHIIACRWLVEVAKDA